MSRQVISDDSIACLRILQDEVVQVFEVIKFGSRLPDHWTKDSTGGNVKVAEQAQRSMPSVFVFA